MKYAVQITKAAEIDIVRAADYIEYTLLNPQAANALLDKIEKKAHQASEQNKSIEHSQNKNRNTTR